MDLYPHQGTAIGPLLQPRLCFADDQGLGKTITSLVAADLIATKILVVCPTVVLYNWARECLAWTGRTACVLPTGSSVIDQNASVVVVTHGLLLREHIMEQLHAFKADVVIGDEVHMLRGREGKKANAFWGELVPPAPYVWALTGTPMPSWPTDMWMMLSHMWPDEFTETFEQFEEKYCRMVPGPFIAGKRRMRCIGVQRMAELRLRLQGKFLRRLKSEELDLPPLRHEEITLRAKMPHHMLDLEGVMTEEGIEEMLGAKSIEAAFSALLDDTDMSSYRRRCGQMKAPLVVELMEQELRNDPAARRVIFCHHKEVAKAIRDGLAEFGVALITGETSAKQRDRAVELFQTTDTMRVAVCQIVAGGTGVTLTASDDVLFAEVSFVPGENAQARDRVYRIGQTKPCRVRFCALGGTVDEIITRVLRRKTAAIQETFK